MYRWSIQPTIFQALLDAMLGALNVRPAAALLVTPKIELYTNVVAINGQNTWASFTKPTFNGYAAQAVTWSAVGNLLNGDQVLPTMVNFGATAGGAIADTCRGYILSDGATVVYMAEQFQAPVAFATPGDFLDLAVKLVLKSAPMFASN
jgi:hypothetical protein